MRGTLRSLIAAALVALIMPTPARAHRLKAECHVLPDNRVQVDGWYDTTGQPAEGAAVEVFCADLRVLARGKLDAQGLFVFTLAGNGPLRIVINDGQGHAAELQLSEAALAGSSLPEQRSDSGGTRRALSDRRPESPFKDILVGVGFLLAVAAFFMSLRNAHQLRVLQAQAGLTEPAETPRSAGPPTAPDPR